MNIQHQLVVFHHNFCSKWLVVFRLALGLALFVKGIQFVQDNALISEVFHQSLILQKYFWLQTLIPWFHMLGGVFIILGLWTRWVVVIQIPILIGAVLFTHSKTGVFAGQTNWLFSVIVLFFLVLFLIEGGGPLSWDNRIKKAKRLKRLRK